jgi:hypothetical protein
MVTGTQIANAARTILHDSDAARYSDADVLNWINEGQVAGVILNPRAFTVRYVHTLAAGTRQTITQGHAVLDVPRNMASDGVTPGRAIRATSRNAMDEIDAEWHGDTGSYVHHTIPVSAEPKVFYVWPAVTDGKIEVIVSAPPTKLAAIGDSITLDDIYEFALVNYVLFRAYSMDAEDAANAAAAASYYKLFTDAMGAQ